MSELIRKQDAVDAVNDVLAEYIPTFKPWQERIPLDCALKIKALPPVYVPEMNVGDMISRQAAMERLMAQNVIIEGSEYHDGFNAGVNRAQTVIRNLPTVQPKRGHWMIEPTEEPEYCKCSECGYVNLIVEVFALDGYHYCPNCGAKMERNEDGTD